MSPRGNIFGEYVVKWTGACYMDGQKKIVSLMSELIEKQLNKMYEHFNKLNKRKNNMIKEDVKQVVKFVNAKVEPNEDVGHCLQRGGY